MPPSISLPAALAQAVLNYLGKRPYEEVAPLIDGILQEARKAGTAAAAAAVAEAHPPAPRRRRPGPDNADASA